MGATSRSVSTSHQTTIVNGKVTTTVTETINEGDEETVNVYKNDKLGKWAKFIFDLICNNYLYDLYFSEEDSKWNRS